MELSIDPELKNWIMPLSDEEFNGLEESILERGCLQPIEVWDGIIIDGHNRYRICKKHSIPFRTREMHFENVNHAKNYMIHNQLARRNVTPEQKHYLIGKLHIEQKGNRLDNLNRDALPKVQNAPSRKSEQIGELFHVNESTVRRAETFAIAVDTLAKNHGQDIRDKILSGNSAISKRDVMRLVQLPTNEQHAAIRNIRNGMKGKHAISNIFGTPVKTVDDKVIPETIRVPCCNIQCSNHRRITYKQFREFFGVYPEKYGHISIPYCSTICRDAAHARFLIEQQRT